MPEPSGAKKKSPQSPADILSSSTQNRSGEQSLGVILLRRRENLELTLSEAEQATRIRGTYLEAIESGDYEVIKDDVYSKGYVRNYADYLGLDTKPILKIYERERAAEREMKRQSRRKSGGGIQLGLKPIRSSRMVVTPRTFLAVSVGALLLVVLLYIGWQVAVLSAPPRLVISSTESTSVTTSSAFVAGKVEGGADLFINDSPVLVAADGSFRERIAVVDGRNEIKLTVKNRLGKSASQTYVITARLPKESTVPTPSPMTSPTTSPIPGAAATPTPNPIDGVQSKVQIGDAATWIIIEADGKEIFRGTMLAGTSQIFAAADQLKLATGNAGVTSVTLSNKVVSNKNLGVLGAAGEVKRDVIWDRDSKQ